MYLNYATVHYRRVETKINNNMRCIWIRTEESGNFKGRGLTTTWDVFELTKAKEAGVDEYGLTTTWDVFEF